MANLLVEIGNTALKAAWSEGMTLGRTFRYQGEKTMDYVMSLIAKEKPEIMVIATVNFVSEDEEAKLKNHCSRLVILDRNHTDILRYYSLPEYLGYDRAASVIAVRKLFKDKSVTVFDFGTTISIDHTDAAGTYLGGNISPGCRTRFKSLGRYSKSLPLVNTPKTVVETGSSLISGIEAGVVSGIVFEIEGYISRSPESVTVFTGGDADYFAKLTGNSVFIVSNLVLMGLASITLDYEN